MNRHDHDTIVTGAGPTARAALQALLDQLPRVAPNAARGQDASTIVRASAATLEALIPRLVEAILAAGEDLDLSVTAVALDGLMETDDGWRAWGTVTGPIVPGATAPRWTAAQATVTRQDDGVAMRLLVMEQEETGDG